MAKVKQQKLPRGVTEQQPGIFMIQYHDAAGKRHREVGGYTAHQVIDRLTLRRAEKLKGEVTKKPAKAVTLSILIDDTIAYAKAQNDPVNAHDQELKLNRIRADFGNREADSIKKNDIIDWLVSEAEDREWKPSTRNRYQSAWSLISRVAIDNEKTDRNPIAGLKRLPENNSRVRYLTADEEKRLTVAIARRLPGYVSIFTMSIHTAMRASEQLRGVVGDFNADTGMLTIHQKKNRNAPDTRHVPMTPIAIAAYNQLAAGKAAGDRLCLNTYQEAMQDTRYWFLQSVEEAGLIDFTWHDLRHTAASRWAMAGVPLSVIAKFMGHGSIQMTMRYAHLMPDNNAKAVEAMMSYYPERSAS